MHVCSRIVTYTGTRANGALIGIPTKHHNSLLLCSDSRSVASVLNTLVAFVVGIIVSGKTRWFLSFPSISSSLRLVDRGGTDLSPHSS